MDNFRLMDNYYRMFRRYEIRVSTRSTTVAEATTRGVTKAAMHANRRENLQPTPET